jgi:hypothetical protein
MCSSMWLLLWTYVYGPPRSEFTPHLWERSACFSCPYLSFGKCDLIRVWSVRVCEVNHHFNIEDAKKTMNHLNSEPEVPSVSNSN